MSEMKLPAQVDIKLDPYNKNRILLPEEHTGFIKGCLEKSPIEDALRARIAELEEAISKANEFLENGMSIMPERESRMAEYFGILRSDVETALNVLKGAGK